MRENTRIVPSGDAVEDLLSAVLDRDVTVRPGRPLEIKKAQTLHWGLYTDDKGLSKFACVCDLAMAANAGAALLLFPSSRAKENISTGRLEDVLAENFREILNISAQLL